jgi:dTDP-4-dehydrorhamnose 3,5-epimerase
VSLDFLIKSSPTLPGVKIITPSVNDESRGSIWTSYSSDYIDSLLPDGLFFKHDKFSSSFKNVLRGIHGDSKSWKLISCVQGSIMQVIVDMRNSSNTFLKWESFQLGDNNKSSVLIPPGMGNAFYVSSEVATYHYKLAYEGDYIDAEDQFTVSWNDPRINIDWPTQKPILSNRDAEALNGNY